MPRPRARSEPARPMVVAQSVEVEWTKKYRGGAAAENRARAPEAVALPFPIPPGHQPVCVVHVTKPVCVVHAVRFTFGTYLPDSVPRDQVEVYPASRLSFRSVIVHPATDLVRVEFKWRADEGAPPRDRANNPAALVLRPGEWGRVRYNGRKVWEETWAYAKRVLNIGFFAEARATIFLDTEPVAVYSQMARLR